jgi:hypothetical protein
VVVTFDTPEARAATKHEAKIGTHIFRNQSIRAGVELIWNNTYTNFPASTYGHAIPWARAKAATAKFLLAESSALRREARPTTAIINKIKLAHDIQTAQGPSQAIADRINEYNQELKAAYKKRAQDTYAAHLRALKDETSTKQFYQAFKAKHASGDIPELVVTPDWDNPAAKFGTADTTPLILKEFRNYFSRLSADKPSEDAEEVLQTLRNRPIPQAAARGLEFPFVRRETRRALRSMAKRKAAGPDKLPAEFYLSFEDLILDRFHSMILEACDKGELPEGLTCGDIIVLYKKKQNVRMGVGTMAASREDAPTGTADA